MSNIIKIENLKIFNQNSVLVDISLEIEESLALIGESGSGKSLTLKALLNLLPKNLSMQLKAENLPKEICIVVQNPFTALSPLTKISNHFEVDKKEQEILMRLVNLNPYLLNRFPNELSGGQLQRIVIALALSVKPKLLLLDEPTTALDSDTKIEILNMIYNLKKEFGFKILYVTHDIESSKYLCNNIAILKNGQIIEKGNINDVLKNPKEAYTKNLIQSNFKNRGFRS